MADRKYHWAIQVTDPSQHRHAWKAYAGGHYAQACGRKHKSVLCDTADQFVAKVKVNPDWYCFDCAKAARLALAKESASKPADVVWPKPLPISEADKNTRYLCWFPSTREWLLSYPNRCFFRDSAIHCATHFLPLPPSPEVK